MIQLLFVSGHKSHGNGQSHLMMAKIQSGHLQLMHSIPTVLMVDLSYTCMSDGNSRSITHDMVSHQLGAKQRH
jgi:hypothetical protein